mmetsp:Transcript_21766/g.41523  ORF Transcript_21766/g.41523 Transcript_21766/m.41523 type:complete len:402 (+) Transcript_21766:716-1921(+)
MVDVPPAQAVELAVGECHHGDGPSRARENRHLPKVRARAQHVCDGVHLHAHVCYGSDDAGVPGTGGGQLGAHWPLAFDARSGGVAPVSWGRPVRGEHVRPVAGQQRRARLGPGVVFRVRRGIWRIPKQVLRRNTDALRVLHSHVPREDEVHVQGNLPGGDDVVPRCEHLQLQTQHDVGDELRVLVLEEPHVLHHVSIDVQHKLGPKRGAQSVHDSAVVHMDLTLPQVVIVIPHAVGNARRHAVALEEGVHPLQLPRLFGGGRVDCGHHNVHVAHEVGVHRRPQHHQHHAEQPLHVRHRGDVAVADSCHGGHGPIERRHVFGVGAFAQQALGRDPSVELVSRRRRHGVKHTRHEVGDDEDYGQELEQAHHAAVHVQLQPGQQVGHLHETHQLHHLQHLQHAR